MCIRDRLYAYVVKLDSASGVRFWNLFLGQDGADIPTGIAVDAADNIYVVGYTDGTWGSLIRAYTGSNYSFVAKLSQWACGNAVVEASEECDDGNTDDGDCCASTCNFEAVGASCADGDLCNGNETCDGAGSCDAGAPLDCSDGDLCTQDSCDPVLGCENVGEPATGCVDGWGKGMLLVKEKVGGKEKLIAKFIKGPDILAAEFGDPREVGGTRTGSASTTMLVRWSRDCTSTGPDSPAVARPVGATRARAASSTRMARSRPMV